MTAPRPSGLWRWALALVPLALLAGVLVLVIRTGDRGLVHPDAPPVESLHVLRHTLGPDRMVLHVFNDGPDPVTVAQVMVRGAFWNHQVLPSRTLEPLQTASVVIPFPWNAGEPVAVTLLTSTGLTFEHEIEVALPTPGPSLAALGRFALLGSYVGVIPVLLGIAWFPVLRGLSARRLGFLLQFTVGLLAFLVVDAAMEGFEASSELPGAYHGEAVFLLGLVGAFLVLQATAGGRSGQDAPWRVAWLIALGIGLHNLGEGLAIGSAYVLGEVTLGTLLVVGFTLHNTTEGIAIVAPMTSTRPGLGRLAGMGLLAGAPTIAGCWMGAFTYSPLWSVLFLGVGAGAIAQVIVAIEAGRGRGEVFSAHGLAGLALGYLVMLATGYLVAGA